MQALPQALPVEQYLQQVGFVWAISTFCERMMRKAKTRAMTQYLRSFSIFQ
jgi:hypothetical protein